MITNFVYNGYSLSNLGYAVVSFENAKNGEIDTDSNITYNHLSFMRGKKQPFISAVYEDPLEMKFYIAKNICDYDENSDEPMYDITVSNMSFLKRWLVSPTPHNLTIESDDDYYNNIYWRGSFKVEEYVFGDRRIGALLTFECDAPFGYYTDVTYSGTLVADGSYSYNCTSDEIGWLYPTLTITLLESGDLELTNSADGRITRVNNCLVQEVITFTPNLQISTTFASHKITNDFNYQFYRVNNQMTSIVNTIESNLAIRFSIEYAPICKAVIV